MKNKIKIFLSIFFPLTYIIGVALTEIFLFIFIIFLIINFKEEKIYNKNILFFLILFSFYIFLMQLFKYSDSKYSSVFHFRYILFAVAIYFIFNL